jgi:archaellum component FlaC
LLLLALKIIKPEKHECEELTNEICAIAVKYNALAAVAGGAPRLKEIEEKLEALHNTYADLAHQIRLLDSATLHDPRARARRAVVRA